jgi:hypothetical protein
VTRFLLDTNIPSQLVRRAHGANAERIRGVGAAVVCTSVIGARIAGLSVKNWLEPGAAP